MRCNQYAINRFHLCVKIGIVGYSYSSVLQLKISKLSLADSCLYFICVYFLYNAQFSTCKNVSVSFSYTISFFIIGFQMVSI